MGQFNEVVSQLIILGLIIYALLLVMDAPFGAPKLANRYAKWIYNSALNVVVLIIKLPFKLLSQLLFGKRKRKKKRRR